MTSSSEAIGQTKTPGKRPHTKILVDGGGLISDTPASRVAVAPKFEN